MHTNLATTWLRRFVFFIVGVTSDKRDMVHTTLFWFDIQMLCNIKINSDQILTRTHHTFWCILNEEYCFVLV